jgi:hypothetical protein
MMIIQITDTKRKEKCNKSLLLFIKGELEVQGKL